MHENVSSAALHNVEIVENPEHIDQTRNVEH